MSFQELLVALVSLLDSLAVGLIIIPIVYFFAGIFRSIEALTFALFRVLISEARAKDRERRGLGAMESGQCDHRYCADRPAQV